MKFGDVVIYKEFGNEYPALVLSTRELEHHGGENDEPLINLAFVKEVKNGAGDVVNVSGSSREAEQIQFRHDVAHESHEFSDEAKAELTRLGQLPPGGEVPGGRYVEARVRVVKVDQLSGGFGLLPIADSAVASTKGETISSVDPAATPQSDGSEAPADKAEAGEDPAKETVQ